MLKKRSTKLMCLLIAFVWMTIVIGSSYAYYIQNVDVANNVVAMGDLRAELYWRNPGETNWQDASKGAIFNHRNWEPGYSDVKYLNVRNTGDLAFQYELNVFPAELLTGRANLLDVIDVYYGENVTDVTRDNYAKKLTCVGTMTELLTNEHGAGYGILLPENSKEDVASAARGSVEACMVLHMQETAGNEYQGLSVGDGFTVQLAAAHYMSQTDSFGTRFDQQANDALPVLNIPTSMITDVTPAGGLVPYDVHFSNPVNGVSATVPAGAKMADGATSLKLVVERKQNSDAKVNLTAEEELFAYNVKVIGLAADNTVPVIINMGEVLPNGLNLGNYDLYHVENGVTVKMTLVDSADLDAHNEFTYDPVNGAVSLAMATFSEVALVADTVNPWEGNFDYSWYTNAVIPLAEGEADYVIANADQLAAFGAIVGGMDGQTQDSFKDKTVKLVADVNLGDKESENDPDLIFYPIGYYNSEGTYERTHTAITSGLRNFEGTFDGNGHKIANFYQNTWEMKGDHDWYSPEEQYYRDGMGLFGRVYGGTVKNLTVENFKSDGEIATTGVIAAYADGATFENIAITNCNPRVYNIGNGGIVGCVGWYAKEAGLQTTFTNITVDNSNKISALWGSYDVACGGIVGQYYPTSGQTSADTLKNGGIKLNNCHVSAQMDVYNDVCGNYQYYAYRYAGMMIGSIRENTTNEDGKTIPKMDGITAEKCTVNYGDWNDYYYCEFEKNGHPSYAGADDYKFSRVPHSELNFTDSNGNGLVDANERASVTGCKHTHTPAENNQAIYLPFHQLFTGYSWGVSSIGLDRWQGVTALGITAGTQEESVVKFNSAFPSSNVDEETGVIATDFLYRVGNQNTVSVGSLFTVLSDYAEGSKHQLEVKKATNVHVTVDPLNDDMKVSGTFTANTSDWTNGTIKFNGTGVVKVTIQDYNFCTPTVLYLEVVDAKNATTATDATANNVVLLNDISGGFTVSDGYAFYGNGFKVICAGNGSYRSAALSYGFVTVEKGGVLDNVQIICDTFPESYLYTREMKAGSDGRYPYGYSAVVISGNSTISNSYIYGARNNIQIGDGNVTVKNTVTECGSLSNIHINSNDSYTVTLDNVTTIQYQTTSKYDTSKKVLGFGILVGTNESESNSTVKLMGDLKQYNWVTSEDTSVSNTYAKTAIAEALKVSDYQHTIDNVTAVNMGIVYLNSEDATITDNRENRGAVPYRLENITMSSQTGQVYSIAGGSITASSRYDAQTDKVIPYMPTVNAPSMPTLAYSDVSEAIVLSYNATDGKWTGKLAVDLDNIDGSSYTFKFNELTVQKYGNTLSYKIQDSDGNAVEGKTSITLNELMKKDYVLVVTDNQIYDENGNLTGETLTHDIPFILSATKTSIDPPKFTNAGTATAIRLVSSKGGEWRPAYTVLTGVSVTYWSASEGKVMTVDLSTLYNSGTISSNVWTYTCNDYTLAITGGAVHSDGTTITPVVANNTLYFASTNKAFGTGTTSRNIILTYVFTDKNDSSTWNRTETVEYSKLSEYDYNSFKNDGTLKEPSSGGTCLAAGTLITLADGSKKEIQHVTYEDQLLVWDFYKGEYAAVPSALIVNHGMDDYTIIELLFDDGTRVKAVNAHAFFDADENKFVLIDAENAEEFIGHKFVKNEDSETKTVELVECKVYEDHTASYTLVSAGHYNFLTEGIFSLTNAFHQMQEGLVVGDDLRYDEAILKADIATYGVYTYEDYANYITEEQFMAFGGPHLKISVGKGYTTYEYTIDLIKEYLK